MPNHTALPGEAGDVRDLLLRISREMVSAPNLSQLLQTMVNAALLIVPSADKCTIHLLSGDGSRLHAQVCSTPSLATGASPGMPADVGVAGRALRECRTICVNDIAHSPDFRPLRSGSDLRALLVAPLYVTDTRLGTLSLSSSHTEAFGPDDEQNMRTLAAQASVAIRQASLRLEAVAERERNDAIIESMCDGLLLLGAAGQIVRINPALYQVLGLDPGDMRLPCGPDEEGRCPEALRALLAPAHDHAGDPYTVQIALVTGQRIALRVISSPLRTPDAGQVLIVHDITAEQEAAEARGVFISQVTHELRTPLQHIMGFTSLISDITDLPRDSYQAFFSRIQDESQHLARLVDDLGEMSRLERGRFSVYLDRLRLDALVADVVDTLTARAQFKELTLALHNVDRPIWVDTDAIRVKQVLGNLIENAFKYVPAGRSVDVTVQATERDVTVSVTDTGMGIPAEALVRIFDSFYQVKPNEQRGNKGMGLGLYISREIIHALGGEIWAESTVGVGSTFAFRLPRPNATPDD